jgi:hypothetical protein
MFVGIDPIGFHDDYEASDDERPKPFTAGGLRLGSELHKMANI